VTNFPARETRVLGIFLIHENFHMVSIFFLHIAQCGFFSL
jgi:hypothetical protein